SGSPFGAAAARPGLHIWRVEQLRPVEVPEATRGVFFSGDAYLVLHNGPEERAHLHLWLGRDSSQDERGACALLSTQLSSLLGERPVTHREVQGNESDLFMEYFPRGLTYQQEGGVASAFKPTRPSPGPGPAPKLYQVKGKRKIRASEREPTWASFNTGDCFLLDLEQTLFVWCGARSNVLERSRAQELATAIRDSERGGKARLEIVADGEEPPEMIQVLGPKPPLQEGSPEEDVAADQSNAGAAVSDATGRMDLTQVAAGSPFSQSLLCPDDCFVLDNGAGGKVYVWKGRKANEQERQAALRVAEEVIARMGHPPQTQVGAGDEGCPEAGMGGITPSRSLSPPCSLPCPTRWKSCPRAVRQPSSSSSSPAGNEQQVPMGLVPIPGCHQACAGCAIALQCLHPCHRAFAHPIPMPLSLTPLCIKSLTSHAKSTPPLLLCYPCAFAHPMSVPCPSPCHLQTHVVPVPVPFP
ncbi:CAPG protein, partial [Smithornis capensis]|nr:CAPG protein [Smithornis capensis]